MARGRHAAALPDLVPNECTQGLHDPASPPFFNAVFNPPNAEPIVMERITSDTESRQGGPACW